MPKQVNVILMRGLIGNVYSRGMDALGSKLAKLPGVDYVSVEDYASWRSIRDRITRYRDPTVIGGHSFGSNAATIIAEMLQPRISFPLMLSFDPSQHFSWSLWQRGPSRIFPNVARVVNFYQAGGLIGDQKLIRADGSTVGIINQLVGTTHTEIDDLALLHDKAIEEVKRLLT